MQHGSFYRTTGYVSKRLVGKHAGIRLGTKVLSTPKTNSLQLTEKLGQAWGISSGASVVQYLGWAEDSGLLNVLAESHSTLQQVIDATGLNESGADALLCILAALQLVSRNNQQYQLTDLAKEYLVHNSPFYIGEGLYWNRPAQSLPPAFMRNGHAVSPMDSPSTWSAQERLRIQHSRNFAPSVVAARSGKFRGVQHLVDLAGGSGVLSIPLAQDNSSLKITLVDLPDLVPLIKTMLGHYGLDDRRIDVRGCDVFEESWNFGPCDGIHIGNFFHSLPNSKCQTLCRKAFESLAPPGRIWLHEVLLDEGRDGPLLAALWHANMIMLGNGGKQRTLSELGLILESEGFSRVTASPTSGGFSLIEAVRT